MSDIGYIKLHRSLLNWEWWDDHNATRLLIYLLIKVNWTDKKWKGILIEAGSLVTSWERLSKDTGLSKQQVRTAMSKLENSKEVTRKATNKNQHIRLVKWEKLQSDEDHNKQTNRQLTGKQHSNNIQITPTKESKEYKEGKEEHIPAIEEFISHARTIDIWQESMLFQLKAKYNSWKDQGWKDGNDKKIKNWKNKLNNTIPYFKRDAVTNHTIPTPKKQVNPYQELMKKR